MMKITKKLFKRIENIQTNIKLLEKVQDYVDAIDYLQESFSTRTLWYRGISHTKYKLIPKVYRDRLWEYHEDYESWIFVDFTNKARSFIANHNSYNEWQWYFTMQHYGLPTRLLDWTEASLVALYFAVRNPENTYIPSVYIFDPIWFDEFQNNKKSGDGVVYNTDEKDISEDHKKLLSSYFELNEDCPCFPICIQPPFIDKRIYSQKSVFTMHGQYINPFNTITRKNKSFRIAKLRFSTRSAINIKDQLHGMGITEGGLFPDLEGLAKDLKWEYGIK